ncbi:MAG: hypothetical protein J5905_06460 [Prevotella sp.]|nr:hypothetical protein [Prevotella sp.]
MRKIFYLLLLLILLASCSAKRTLTETVMVTESTRAEQKDSVAERSTSVSDTHRYTGRDRLREITRTYIITPLGDTVKSHVQEKETEHTWDSLVSAQRSEIERLREKVGSLCEKLQKNSAKEKVVEKKPSVRQRIGEALMWLVIGAVVMFVFIKKIGG